MTVWVDYMCRQGRWRHGNEAWHMFGDDPAELHALAARIGLRLSWFQDAGSLPHYDLTRNKRRQALAAGAVAWTGTPDERRAILNRARVAFGRRPRAHKAAEAAKEERGGR